MSVCEQEDAEEFEVLSKSGRARRASKQTAQAALAENELDEELFDGAFEEEDYDLLCALKAKLKLVVEEMDFRQKVELKFDRETQRWGYTNRYKDAQTPLEVKLSFKAGKKKVMETQSVVQQKWKKWDLVGQKFDTLQTLAAYLFRIEKELRGLIDGQWLTPNGRTNWTELVKGASDVNDISLAVVQLEAALKSIAVAPTWFTSEEASVNKKKGRGRKKTSEKEEKKQAEYDWEEMKKAGILDDTSGMEMEEDKEEEDQENIQYCWIGGSRAVPFDIALSAQSIRNAILSGGELPMHHFVYTGKNSTHIYLRCMYAPRENTCIVNQEEGGGRVVYRRFNLQPSQNENLNLKA